nr:uncharacterized protein LOC119176523 [Rhipicephalus microplus]
MACSRWAVLAVLLLLAVPSLSDSTVADDETVATEEQVAASGMDEDEGTKEQAAPADSQEEPPADETWAKAESVHELEAYGCGEPWEACDAERFYDDHVEDDK